MLGPSMATLDRLGAKNDVAIAERGEVEIGETMRYQYWYRDPNVWICDNGFNLTNGYEITWTP